jgi:HAE1 family hydrophobic/amphiphilic exporter-1
MGFVGVYCAYWITGDSYDSSARIGLVLIIGIAVNNAILLTSRFRHEASLVLKAKRGGDPEAEAALFSGFRKTLGGSDLYQLDPKERPALLRRAIARATRIRLRSVLLTSGTTVVGMAPLLLPMPDFLSHLFGGSETQGKDIWENLALTSIGGLISSTVLLILALPPTYYLCVRVWWLVRRAWAALWSRGRSRKLSTAPGRA